MKKLLIFSFYVLIFSVLHAQSFENKSVKVEDKSLMNNSFPPKNFLVNSDDDYYYVFYNRSYQKPRWAWDNYLLVMNKDLSSFKKIELKLDKNETYFGVFFSENHFNLICSKYNSKSKTSDIVRKIYNKQTGIFITTEILATISTPSKSPVNLMEIGSRKILLYGYSAMSPDKTKFAISFLTENKDNKINSVHNIIFNQAGEVILNKLEALQISNSEFLVQDIALSNEAILANIYYSIPKDNKSKDQSKYIDVTFISESINEHISIKLGEKESTSTRIKYLKNGNLFFTSLFKEKGSEMPSKLITAIFDMEDIKYQDLIFNEIPKMPAKSPKTSVGLLTIPQERDYSMVISDIKEFETGEISIIAEQTGVYYESRTFGNVKEYYPIFLKGNIVTFFANSDGEITSNDVFKHCQETSSVEPSFYAFLYNNNLYYIFNDNPSNSDGKDEIKKFSPDLSSSVNAVIKYRKIFNENEQKTFYLSNETGEERYLYGFLFQNENKLLVSYKEKSIFYFDFISLE
ncbi:MAG: hypothetical protein LBV69_03285 [Bacteroidales bacterium]|jgi:hypothetical protein|nr:hypothetical protein [Bacteroidales bacterium]